MRTASDSILRCAIPLAAAILGASLLAACAPGAVRAAGVASASVPASVSRRLDFDDARHLLTRAGFAPAAFEIERYVGRTRETAVDALLASTRTAPTTSPPPWTEKPGNLLRGRRARNLTADEREALQRERRQRVLELREWWLAEMVRTDSALTERMTLFWHGHFATSVTKVRDARLMYEQNALFRRDGLGSFAALLHAVTRDPAMLIWLDGARNRRGAPNENYAREVMELFTLGEGHCTQTDVVQAARAFTGLGVDRESGRFVYRPRLHDSGYKTLLGRSGDLDADSAIDAILAQPETARFIVRKLWREFVSPTPDATEVATIAGRFYHSGYDIKVALRSLFLSDAFWAPENRGVLVKSPVELAVGAMRALGAVPRSMRPVVVATARMGESLFAPPNVRGWPGGDAWITSATLLARKEFLVRLSRGMPVAAGSAGLTISRASPADRRPPAAPGIVQTLLPLPPVSDAVREASAEHDPLAEIRAALLDPVYQLK